MIVVKAPVAGRSKTRLIPRLGDEGAADLAAAMFRDTVSMAGSSSAAVIVSFAPADGLPALTAIADLADGRAVSVDAWLPQCDGSLTERLNDLFQTAFRLGYGPLIALGADSPALPPGILRDALHVLQAAHDGPLVVLGPTEDGGYNLVGMTGPECLMDEHGRSLFGDIPWSTDQAFRATAENACRMDIPVRVLDPWYDIDTPGDLDRLIAEFDTEPDTVQRAAATFGALADRQSTRRVTRSAVDFAGEPSSQFIGAPAGHPRTSA
jgi:hypothetical protein